MALTTPAEWLPVLSKRMDEDMPRIQLLASYRNGDAPLPEADRNTQEAWRRFQQQARTNWGLLIQEAVADRILPIGITVAGKHDSVEAKRAQLIWQNNRMKSLCKDWVRDGLTFSQSYLTVWSKPEGGDVPVITNDSPETMCVATDPLQPWRPRAALKIWCDLDAGEDYAMVWVDGARQPFKRGSYTTSSRRRRIRQLSGGWEPDGPVVETDGSPPVVIFRNPGGAGEYEHHVDLIDRINAGILRRLTIEALLAFRQRALRSKEGGPGLPKTDADGNEIDWSKVLPFAAGALWNLPPGIEIWESAPTDTNPLLTGSRDDIRQLSSSTRTPLPMLMPDNANQTAKGAAATESGYLAKCEDRRDEAQLGAAAVLVEAMKADGTELQDTLEVAFAPVEQVSLSERYAAAQAAAGAKVPQKMIWREVLGWSPDKIAQAEADAAADAFRELLTAPIPAPRPTPPAPQRVNGNAPAPVA